MTPLRILHCPWVIGGHSAGLAAAERQLGLDSRTVVFQPSPYGYPVDEILWEQDDGAFAREAKRWPLLLRALRDFDVIHFNFGSTIAPERVARDALGPERAEKLRSRVWAAYAAAVEQLDLRLLARAGKAIFVTFQGSDARQGDLAARREVTGGAEAARAYSTPGSDQIKRRRIACFDRYADGIYALNPDLLRVLPRRARFMPYAHVNLGEWQPLAPAGSRGRLLIAHAPTNRLVKGTRYVLEAISRLQTEGLEFDFRLVEGLTNSAAKELYRRADLVVDQLILGWYGGVAVEAMALERPVVSYLHDEDLGFLPSAMRAQIPVICAEPNTIYRVLRELLTTRRSQLTGIGQQGREYVHRWHDSARIAEQLAAEYEIAVAARRRRS